jgi:hypothetical protein
VRTTVQALTLITALLLAGCAATPAPPAPSTPSATVTSTQPTVAQSQSPSLSPSLEPTTPAPTPTPAPVVLTVKNNREVAALMAEKDYCSESIASFAAKYEGRTIAFNGSIAAMNNHEDYTTRYDILLAPGDRGSSSTIGPAFQFSDVNMFDLNLTGSNVPDAIGLDDKLRIVAQVGSYNSTQCLFFLHPISTAVR